MTLYLLRDSRVSLPRQPHLPLKSWCDLDLVALLREITGWALHQAIDAAQAMRTTAVALNLPLSPEQRAALVRCGVEVQEVPEHIVVEMGPLPAPMPDVYPIHDSINPNGWASSVFPDGVVPNGKG